MRDPQNARVHDDTFFILGIAMSEGSSNLAFL